ncbi:MAG TPA: EamA family transporter [Candidatus Limnocylindria bacterium]|nr:EamA family transporter [Candidatus Limnocylindria bacterium]
MSRAAPRTAPALPTALALLTVYVVWGSTYLAIAYVVDTMPPFLSAGVRYLVAGAMMLAFLWLHGRFRRSATDRERPTLAHWRSAAIIGTLLLLGGNGFVVLAEQPGLLTSGIAAVLVATVPIWLNLFDAVLDRRRPSALLVGGVVAGFGGVVILLIPSDGVADVNPFGVLLVLFATLSWAVGSLYQRRADLPRSPWLGTGMEMVAGGGALLLAATLTGEPVRTDVAAFSTESIVALAYLVVFGSLLGFSAYIWLLNNAPVSTAATYAYVNPIVAVALGAWLRAEEITPRTLLAAVIIIGAVIAMVSGRPRQVDEAGPAPEAAGVD